MTTLHVKSPNVTQKDVDIDKICTTDGFTMNGDIVTRFRYRNTVDDSYLVLCGGTAYNKGSFLKLYGEQSTDDPGGFELSSKTQNSTTRALRGHNDGLLEWNGSICINYPRMFEIQSIDHVKGTVVTTAVTHGILSFIDKNRNVISSLYQKVATDGRVDIGFLVNNWNSSDHSGVYMSSYPNGDNAFTPNADNGVYLGLSNARWRAVYTVSGTINTSDERVKDNITSIPDDVLDAWSEVNWYQFQFKDAIAEKGDDARIHTGAIAQRIKSIFESHGIDAFRYGLLCYDEWDADEESVDEDGNITTPAKQAGNMYSLRYEEALCMEAAYQRRRADRLEERIARLEALLESK